MEKAPGHAHSSCQLARVTIVQGPAHRPACQGRTGLLGSPGLPGLSTSINLIMAGHAPVQWHQCTMGKLENAGVPQGQLMAVPGQQPAPPGPRRGCPTLLHAHSDHDSDWHHAKFFAHAMCMPEINFRVCSRAITARSADFLTSLRATSATG